MGYSLRLDDGSLPPSFCDATDSRIVHFPSETPISCAEIRAHPEHPTRFSVRLSAAITAFRFRVSGVFVTPGVLSRVGGSRDNGVEVLSPGAVVPIEAAPGNAATELLVLVDHDHAASAGWLGGAVGAVFDRLREDAAAPSDRISFRETAAITGILHGLVTRSLTGAAERVFVHGCACALFALAAEELLRTRRAVPPEFRLTASDRAALAEAHRIILENYVEPPGIDEIAHRTGLNTTRLKTGFRAVYGVTVFGLVREERMKTALILLRDHGQNVTETAYAVGYHSLSAFAAVFKKTFGFSPHKVRRTTQTDTADRLECGPS